MKQINEDENKKYQFITGLIVPIEWESNKIKAITLSTFDENEYIIELNNEGKKLLKFPRTAIKAFGRIYTNDIKQFIEVRSFTVLKIF